MKPVVTASLALAFSISSFGTAPATTVLFGSVADFAPYNYLDDEGELQGFEAALAEEICTRANLTCDWALAPWNDMISELLAGEFDVIMTAMQITEEREVYISFSEEYFPADPSGFLALSGNSYPSSFAVVGALNDTLQADYISDEGWALAGFSDTEEALQALLANEISAFVADQAALEEIIEANSGVYSLVATDVIIGGGIGLGVRQSSASLLSSLNTALASLKTDGTLDSLIGSWFDGRDPNYREAE